MHAMQATLCVNTPTTHISSQRQTVLTRMDELANVEALSQMNNLTLNGCPSLEIVFTDCRRWKRSFQQPPLLPNGLTEIAGVDNDGVDFIQMS